MGGQQSCRKLSLQCSVLGAGAGGGGGGGWCPDRSTSIPRPGLLPPPSRIMICSQSSRTSQPVTTLPSRHYLRTTKLVQIDFQKTNKIYNHRSGNKNLVADCNFKNPIEKVDLYFNKVREFFLARLETEIFIFVPQ